MFWKAQQYILTSCIERLLNELIFKLFNLANTFRDVCAGDSLGLLLRSSARLNL